MYVYRCSQRLLRVQVQRIHVSSAVQSIHTCVWYATIDEATPQSIYSILSREVGDAAKKQVSLCSSCVQQTQQSSNWVGHPPVDCYLSQCMIYFQAALHLHPRPYNHYVLVPSGINPGSCLLCPIEAFCFYLTYRMEPPQLPVLDRIH